MIGEGRPRSRSALVSRRKGSFGIRFLKALSIGNWIFPLVLWVSSSRES